MNAITPNPFRDAWRALGDRIGKPAAVLCVSAHWCTRGIGVTAMEVPPTIHDFHGFPRALHELRYPAPGSPALAGRVGELLGPDIAVPVRQGWGLDHGAWQILVHLLPDADVPVVQLSLDASRGPEEHLTLARRLRPLRDEGVLVLGSGNIVHNLAEMRRGDDQFAYPWAIEFRDWARDRILARDAEALARYDSRGESALRSAPTPEHYLPLLYAAAIVDEDEPTELFCDAFQGGSIAMLSFVAGLS